MVKLLEDTEQIQTIVVEFTDRQDELTMSRHRY